MVREQGDLQHHFGVREKKEDQKPTYENEKFTTDSSVPRHAENVTLPEGDR